MNSLVRKLVQMVLCNHNVGDGQEKISDSEHCMLSFTFAYVLVMLGG